MRILTIPLLFCCIYFSSTAQVTISIPASVSVAGTSTADLKHWSPFHNPAVSTGVSSPQIACRVENRYLLAALTQGNFSLVYPTGYGVPALSFAYFGNSVYHEMMTGLSFARDFSGKFRLGIQFNHLTYFQISTGSYPATLFPQAGLIVHLTSELDFGFHTFNPFQATIKSTHTVKRIPSLFSVGMNYDFSEQFTLNLQAEKEIGSLYRFAGACSYFPSPGLGFQFGMSYHDFLVPAFGFEVHLKSFSFDLGAELHPLLGTVTTLGVSCNFKPHDQ